MIQGKIGDGEIILGQKKGNEPDEDWILSIGEAINREKEKIKLDITAPHITFICGARGSGKSYSLGVIAEEIAKNNSEIGAVIVDPIGVFWSMKYPNKEKGEIELLQKRGMKPEGIENLQVFVPTGYKHKIPEETFDTDFSFKASNLKTEDWCLTFGIDRYNPQGLLLERAIEKVKEGYTRKLGDRSKGGSRDVPSKEEFTIDDLLECINHDRELLSKEKGFKGSTRRALTSRLTAAKDWGIFGKEKDISDLVNPGEITVIDTSFLSENIGSLVLGILARKILSARKAAAREEAVRDLRGEEEKRSGSIPPTWLMIDEAHNFAPSSGKTAATDALVEYVKEGRRPGLSAVLSTQQPSALNSKIISQLDILLSHRLTFENDIKEVRKRIPTALPEDLKEPDSLKGLPEGSALTADREIKRAFITSIRPRLSQHEGRERVTKDSDGESITEPLEPSGNLTSKEEKTQEYSKEKEEILAVPSKINLEEADEIAESKINKRLGIIWSTEKIRKTSKYYYPIWNALIDYHGEDESINLRIHLDGLTGELIRGSNQGLKRTNGVRTLLDLTPSQINLLLEIVQNEPLSNEELEDVLTKKSNIEKVVKSLGDEDLIRISKRKDKRFLQTEDKIDIPTKLSEKSLMRAEAMPEKETKRILPENKLDRVITEEKMMETLEVFGDIETIEIELFYYPYWVIELASGEGSRILAIDGVLGKQDEYVENMLRRRVF